MTEHRRRVQTQLDRFQALRDSAFDYRWAHTHVGGRHDRIVVFQAITHGDEVGPMPALLDVMAALKTGEITYGGTAHFVLGNPEAALENRRFLDFDLNRVFVDPAIVAGGPDTHEAKRARALTPILDTAAVFLDFHQTSQPSARPFYSYPWRPDWAAWTRAIGGATAWTARSIGTVFVEGMRCTDEYVRDNGAMGITLELGLRGFTDIAYRRAHAEMRQTMKLLDELAGGQNLAEAAARNPAPELFATVHVEPFSDPYMALAPGWEGFAPVFAGQLLSAPGTPEVRATVDGALLFPVYPPRMPDGAAVSPPPQTLFRIIQPVHDDPHIVFAPKDHK